MFKKVAITLGIVFIIGLIIITVTGRLPLFLTETWNWIFTNAFGMPSAPPSPFGS